MCKVLIIDDSSSFLDAMRKTLVTAGHQVETALCGREALAAVRRQPFDVAITDIYMPDIDGLEVIREARKIRPSLPCIAMSGKPADLNMLGVARALGAAATLHKPFTPERLLTAIDAAVGPDQAAQKPAGPGTQPPVN